METTFIQNYLLYFFYFILFGSIAYMIHSFFYIRAFENNFLERDDIYKHDVVTYSRLVDFQEKLHKEFYSDYTLLILFPNGMCYVEGYVGLSKKDSLLKDSSYFRACSKEEMKEILYSNHYSE